MMHGERGVTAFEAPVTFVAVDFAQEKWLDKLVGASRLSPTIFQARIFRGFVCVGLFLFPPFSFYKPKYPLAFIANVMRV